MEVKAFDSRYQQFTSCNFLIGYALSALNVSNAASTPAICPCQITSYTHFKFLRLCSLKIRKFFIT